MEICILKDKNKLINELKKQGKSLSLFTMLLQLDTVRKVVDNTTRREKNPQPHILVK